MEKQNICPKCGALADDGSVFCSKCGSKLGEKVFCHGLSDQFAILCDGTVTPCCLDAEGDIALGNIFESDIRTILTSDRAIAIKQGFSKKTAVEDLCRRCGYARRFKI